MIKWLKNLLSKTHKKYNIGEVYYNKKHKKFTQLREIKNKLYMSGPCEYFTSAETVITKVPVTEKYIINNFIKVEDITKFAEYDGIGWTTQKDGDY